MFPKTVKSVKSAARVATVTAVLGVAAVGGVGVANATSYAPEEVYLTALDEEGIPYDSAYYAVALGYAVCGDFESGYDFYDIGLDFLSESSYSPYEAGFIITDAVTVYCPQYTYALPA